jgi:flagellar basal-body rod modification protein FlgD
MANTISSLSATTAATESTGSAAPKANQDVSKEAFMQLLVAQIKNQNPLNPTDGVQFLSQLAQFSELEQLINIKSELSGLRETLTPPPASSEISPEQQPSNT